MMPVPFSLLDLPEAPATVAFDPEAVPLMKDTPLSPSLSLSPSSSPPWLAAPAVATAAAGDVKASQGALTTVQKLQIIKARTIPKSKPAPAIRRPNKTGRVLVESEKRNDNNVVRFLRGIGFARGQYDGRDIGSVMMSLSNALGRVVAVPAAKGQPDYFEACLIVEKKALSVAEQYILYGKKRTTYSDKFKLSLKLLMTEGGLIFVQDMLLSS